MDLNKQIMQALQYKPLSQEEISQALNLVDRISEMEHALYLLRDQMHFIEKHPVFGGCTTCKCNVKFVYRLTFAGRRELSDGT